MYKAPQHLEIELAERLNRVGVADYILIAKANRLEYLRDGIYRACFVVDEHDGHERGIGSDGGCYIGRLDYSVLRGRNPHDLIAVVGELLCRFYHAAVLR